MLIYQKKNSNWLTKKLRGNPKPMHPPM